MIAGLGGALSLYLGISLSMIFEILELFVDFFVNSIILCSGGSKALKKQKDEKQNSLSPSRNLSRVVTPVKPYR